MNRDDFETRVLDLWMKTRIPLTLAHLQYHCNVKRKKLKEWLDEMVVEGVLELDVSDDGEMVWQVPGAERPPSGPRSFAEMEKLDALRPGKRSRGADEMAGLDVARTALTVAGRARNEISRPPKDGEKSLLVSAGLSLLGPVGWLYAGAFKEAIPATIALLIVGKILPAFLLMPILMVALPLSAITGLIYAWQYNKTGERTPLFLGGKSEDK